MVDFSGLPKSVEISADRVLVPSRGHTWLLVICTLAYRAPSIETSRHGTGQSLGRVANEWCRDSLVLSIKTNQKLTELMLAP